MTLATRCPACGTVFRVVQDQLRVSQGWVRCGRCGEAFNALESMVEPPTTPAIAPPPPAVETPRNAEVASAQAWPAPTPATVEPAASPVIEPMQQPAHDAAAAELPPDLHLIASDGAIDANLVFVPGLPERIEPALDAEPPDSVAPPSEAIETLQPPSRVAATEPTDLGPTPSPPSFLVQADRAARWQRPGVRLALGLLALIAATGLAAQAAHAFRDRLAALSPSLRPLLKQACSAWGCQVGEYRQIDALSVESSGLVRVDGSPVYRLSVTLRNRANLEVAAPALDLTLTDAQGRAIARRVLQMSDLHLPLRTLKPGSELPIQVPLGVGDRAVSGYTVEIFYP